MYDKKYVVKVAKSLEKMQKEIEIYKILNETTYIPDIIDYDSEIGYIIMAYYNPLRENTIYSLDTIKKIGMQLMDIIQDLHNHGIIHLDLKTNNILLDADYNVKIIDFNVADLLYGSINSDTKWNSLDLLDQYSFDCSRRYDVFGIFHIIIHLFMQNKDLRFGFNVRLISKAVRMSLYSKYDIPDEIEKFYEIIINLTKNKEVPYEELKNILSNL
jgi:serine/threonine protein kinase